MHICELFPMTIHIIIYKRLSVCNDIFHTGSTKHFKTNYGIVILRILRINALQPTSQYKPHQNLLVARRVTFMVAFCFLPNFWEVIVTLLTLIHKFVNCASISTFLSDPVFNDVWVNSNTEHNLLIINVPIDKETCILVTLQLLECIEMLLWVEIKANERQSTCWCVTIKNSCFRISVSP